jgi:hypothetical protein
MSVDNNFKPAGASRSNEFRLTQSEWSINGVVVTASASDLNNTSSNPNNIIHAPVTSITALIEIVTINMGAGTQIKALIDGLYRGYILIKDYAPPVGQETGDDLNVIIPLVGDPNDAWLMDTQVGIQHRGIVQTITTSTDLFYPLPDLIYCNPTFTNINVGFPAWDTKKLGEVATFTIVNNSRLYSVTPIRTGASAIWSEIPPLTSCDIYVDVVNDVVKQFFYPTEFPVPTSFPSIIEIKEYPNLSLRDGATTCVYSLGTIYYWDSASTATPDDTTVIKPNSILIANPGRWLLVDASGPSGAYLLAANNLSDVSSVATSRTNLGLGTGSDVSFKTITGVIGSVTDTVFVAKNASVNNVSYSFQVKNDAGNYFESAKIRATASSSTAGSETSGLNFYTKLSGSDQLSFFIDTVSGSQITGNFKATGALNTNNPSQTRTNIGLGTANSVQFNDMTLSSSSSANSTAAIFRNTSASSLSISNYYRFLDSNSVEQNFVGFVAQAVNKTAGSIQGNLAIQVFGPTLSQIGISAGSLSLTRLPIDFNGDAADGITTLINTTLAKPVLYTGTALTLDATYNYKIIYCNSSSAITITIPTGLTSTFCCCVVMFGTGQVTIAAGSGATIVNSASAFKALTQYSRININHTTTANTFLIDGEVKV